MDCRLCGGRGHIQSQCPDTWRRYHSTTTTTSHDIVQPPNEVHVRPQKAWCANCARRGHYVHQCRHYSFSCIPAPRMTVVTYDQPLKFAHGLEGQESKSAKKRRLREELKATKRAYKSLPCTPKTKFHPGLAISKPNTPMTTVQAKTKDVTSVLNEAKTTLECLIDSKKNRKNKKRQKKWSVSLPMDQSDEGLEESEDMLQKLRQKLIDQKSRKTPESSVVRNKIKKEMRILKRLSPGSVGAKKKRKLLNLMSRI